jgi:hypothetical protein
MAGGRDVAYFGRQEQWKAMKANGDEHGGKWTDETLSMTQRHELLVEELARLAQKGHPAAQQQAHARGDAPSASSGEDKHAG